MSRPHVPPLRVDPATLPPPLLTSEPDSFAQTTFKVRFPRMVQELIAQPAFSPDRRGALQRFYAELRAGVIQPLREDAPDVEFWNKVSQPYFGRAWLDVPWYWAEAYFYRRLLEITGYFHWGAWHAVDPFGYKKAAELEPHRAPQHLSQLLNALPTAPAARFEVLVHSSLWGNRVDLSYNVAETFGRGHQLEDERANILVDDTAPVWNYLSSRACQQLSVIADNAGAELLMDLALLDFLLSEGIAQKVVLQVKPQPFYVSDALPQDVEHALAALTRADATTRAFAERLRGYLNAGRLVLRTHWFYPTSLLYYQLPDDLFDLLRASDLVILKGDLNYRRTVGDLHWKPTMSFEYVTRYFPAPLVCLRTLKAELIVGLRAGQAEELFNIDPEWRVNGKRGVVQWAI